MKKSAQKRKSQYAPRKESTVEVSKSFIFLYLLLT